MSGFILPGLSNITHTSWLLEEHKHFSEFGAYLFRDSYMIVSTFHGNSPRSDNFMNFTNVYSEVFTPLILGPCCGFIILTFFSPLKFNLLGFYQSFHGMIILVNGAKKTLVKGDEAL